MFGGRKGVIGAEMALIGGGGSARSKFLPALLVTSGLLPVFGGGAVGGADPAWARAPATCSGGNLAGPYTSGLTITGICYVVNKTSVRVDGDLTVAKGAMLDAISPGGTGLLGSALPGNLTVTGNIEVKEDAALLLGWCIEPNQGYGYENCDASELASADDHVGGDLTSTAALAVIVHNVQVSHDIDISGGGGGLTCSTPSLFSEDSDPAINGSQSVGYDFSPVAYSDLESNTVGGNVSVSGLKSCWFGGLRNAVTGSFVFNHNTMDSSDGDEVIDNKIDHDMSCVGNSPAVQFGDSGSTSNVVSEDASGQCGFDVMKYDENYDGGVTLPISVKPSDTASDR